MARFFASIVSEYLADLSYLVATTQNDLFVFAFFKFYIYHKLCVLSAISCEQRTPFTHTHIYTYIRHIYVWISVYMSTIIVSYMLFISCDFVLISKCNHLPRANTTSKIHVQNYLFLLPFSISSQQQKVNNKCNNNNNNTNNNHNNKATLYNSISEISAKTELNLR